MLSHVYARETRLTETDSWPGFLLRLCRTDSPGASPRTAGCLSFVPGQSMPTVRLHLRWAWVGRRMPPPSPLSPLPKQGGPDPEDRGRFGDSSLDQGYLSSLFPLACWGIAWPQVPPFQIPALIPDVLPSGTVRCYAEGKAAGVGEGPWPCASQCWVLMTDSRPLTRSCSCLFTASSELLRGLSGKVTVTSDRLGRGRLCSLFSTWLHLLTLLSVVGSFNGF